MPLRQPRSVRLGKRQGCVGLVINALWDIFQSPFFIFVREAIKL